MPLSRRSFLQAGLAGAAGTLAALPVAGPDAGAESLSSRWLGRPKDELPTPALVLDLDLFEANLARMARHARAAGVALRPHAKTHKCVPIARRQLAAGALGVCAATITEAEALAAGGISGILLTSEMVGPDRLRRLTALTARQPDTLSVVDAAEHADQLDAAAAAAGVVLNVLLDVDPGSRRTGVQPGGPARALAQHVLRRRHLRLRGIHCYSGASAHVIGHAARREHSARALAPAMATFAELRREGVPLEIFSGGSTGTYDIDPALGTFTELQAGSYVFMDVDYRRIGGAGGPVYDDFAPALGVIATVISRNEPRRATIDAGIKAFATDRRFGPEWRAHPGAAFSWGGDEHGILDLATIDRDLALGERLEFIVPHCDPTVNLYDRLHCLRQGVVEAVWPIARGHA